MVRSFAWTLLVSLIAGSSPPFEISALDRDIWLEIAPGAAVEGRPAGRSGISSNHVRVTGILFAKPGASYGHLGGYRFELLASKIEYLGGPG